MKILKVNEMAKGYKPVLKEKDLTAYVSDADMIAFISENAPMDWNKCCDFVRKHHICQVDEGRTYWDKDILKHPEKYDPEAAKWVGAFFEAHPFIEKMMIVFDD